MSNTVEINGAQCTVQYMLTVIDGKVTETTDMKEAVVMLVQRPDGTCCLVGDHDKDRSAVDKAMKFAYEREKAAGFEMLRVQ